MENVSIAIDPIDVSVIGEPVEEFPFFRRPLDGGRRRFSCGNFVIPGVRAKATRAPRARSFRVEIYCVVVPVERQLAVECR